jgi:hypothetical protein
MFPIFSNKIITFTPVSISDAGTYLSLCETPFPHITCGKMLFLASMHKGR